MIGIILAAGRGQKINVLDTPKPLLRVYGKPLIVRQIELLQEAGIRDIVIVVGSYAALVRTVVNEFSGTDVNIRYAEEPNDDAGILHSFSRAAEFVESECVVTSCDLVFENNPYRALSKKSDVEVLVAKHKKENEFSGAPVFVKTRFKKLLNMGRDIASYDALHAGIHYFTKKGITDFLEIARAMDPHKESSEVIMNLHQAAPVKISFLPDMQWFDINAADTLLRAEMFMRRAHAHVGPAHELATLNDIVPTTSFTHTKTQETGIIIEPGILKQLDKVRIIGPQRAGSHHIIITDENVDALFGDSVLLQLQNAGYRVAKFVIPAGEQSKNMSIYNDLAERIIALGIDEQSIIFALGGGVVANVSGLLAATLYRGIGLIHLPTTIMNMLDVSISLKQGINGQKGKNLVGNYYQPLLVVIDPALSIPDSLVRDGISEAIKHAICQDRDFYEYLLNNADNVADVAFRKEVIERTIQLKIELMHEDMFEHKRAMILQYGHEAGHAIEFLSRFDLSHGQSIAIGMRVSAELATLMEAGEDTVDAHKDIFRAYQLPCRIPEYINAQTILDALKYNKKTVANEVRFVLPDTIGKAWKIKGEYGIPCPVELIKKAVENSYGE
ncbi:MAG: NTP transferase domain-containing protein [Parcubacteria group bacterium]|nr:NTP transferase domain-containing protein [Parcubacteria group bacterium]